MVAREKLLFRIRALIIFFIVALIVSGLTAFPVYTELKWIIGNNFFSVETTLGKWLHTVWLGVSETEQKNRFLFYGYDWLAFAHIVIAMAFIGPYRNPEKNKWVIEWAMLCCIAIFPLALIAGSVRGIPWFHIVIDCLFGIAGIIPLWITKRWISELEKIPKH